MAPLPQKIVAAVDGSDESLAAALYAIQLAKAIGATIVTLYVIQLPEYISDGVRARLRDELRTKGQDVLDKVKKESKARVSVSGKLFETTSSVVDAICEFASAEKADVIILGTRGLGGVSKLMLGSVAVGVARSAGCPVLVVR